MIGCLVAGSFAPPAVIPLVFVGLMLQPDAFSNLVHSSNKDVIADKDVRIGVLSSA